MQSSCVHLWHGQYIIDSLLAHGSVSTHSSRVGLWRDVSSVRKFRCTVAGIYGLGLSHLALHWYFPSLFVPLPVTPAFLRRRLAVLQPGDLTVADRAVARMSGIGLALSLCHQVT